MATMEILLLEDMENLGVRGQIVRVKAGYGRNYLLPRKMAVKATPANQKMIEQQRKSLLKREASERTAAEAKAEALKSLELVFERKVGEHGILYGSVTALDIAEEMAKKGYEVDKRRVNLKDTIKTEGEFEATIKLHREVSVNCKVIVKNSDIRLSENYVEPTKVKHLLSNMTNDQREGMGPTLYVNLWVEDENKVVKSKPIKLLVKQEYYFLFSIDDKDRTGSSEVFVEPSSLEEKEISKLDLQVNCLLLADNPEGYLRETLIYYKNSGVRPKFFKLHCNAFGNYYLIVRLFFNNEPIFKQVLAIEVIDQEYSSVNISSFESRHTCY